MEHINVSEFVKANSLHSGRDEEFDCFILDEDKLCDALEEGMSAGGKVLDHHSCDFYPGSSTRQHCRRRLRTPAPPSTVKRPTRWESQPRSPIQLDQRRPSESHDLLFSGDRTII